MGKLTRRAFLISSATILGGVAFGTYKVKTPHANPLEDDLTTGEAAFNPWIKINSEGITLYAPHTDIGQGVRHMQALLLAEELDVELSQVSIETGKPSPAYWNHAMAAEGLPFRSTDHSFLAETVRDAATSLIKVMGMQVTGGSSSAPDSYIKLRAAGASARETLKLAASEKFNVPMADLRTEKAAVILPDGQQIAYTELAANAANLDPVKVETLRPPEQWRLLGKDDKSTTPPRIDVLDKSTGRLTFGIDLRFEGMLFASVRSNPRQGAKMHNYKMGKADSMVGVEAIVPVTNGIAVVANNTWRAIQAVRQIECDWDDAPYPAEMAEHWQAVSDSFSETHLDKIWRDDGDVAGTLSNNDKVLEAEYKAPYVAHQPLEPLSATALYTNGEIELWVAHQMPRIVIDQVAKVTGIDAEKITFNNQYAGGSFGHRLEFEYIKQVAEIAQQMPGKPIQLTYSREEDFAHDFPRQISMARGRGVVEDKQVSAYDLDIASVSSSASQFTRIGMAQPGPDAQIAAGVWNAPYNIPNMRVTAYKVPELAPTSSWRSVGASSAAFFSESWLDELLHAAKLDPLQARLDMAQTESAKRVLNRIKALSQWDTPLEGEGRGRGLALVESFGVAVAEVVEVSHSDAGISIDKVFVVADPGRVLDPINFENQVQGGVVWGLGHAMNCEITYKDGKAEQSNFHQHSGMRLHQCPEIVVEGLNSDNEVRGIGEPPVPPAAPALANAIFAATGQRIREMPFNKHINFA